MNHAQAEQLQQRAEWRARLMADVLSNMHDDETRVQMLFAGLEQAHQEGMSDAADICDGLAVAKPGTRDATVAFVISNAIRALCRLNQKSKVD